jgi:hypothetical protein
MLVLCHVSRFAEVLPKRCYPEELFHKMRDTVPNHQPDLDSVFLTISELFFLGCLQRPEGASESKKSRV